MTTIYPRFLGVDDSGDFVWELATGRWTWGDTPYDAATRQRTFTPDRFIDKYGRPELVPPFSAQEPAPAAPEPEKPAQLVPVDRGGSLGAPGRRGAHRALTAMLTALDQWVESIRENHNSMDHGNENTGDECWRTFAPSDIRDMINDAASQLGLTPFPAPTSPTEDR